jgi:hypothetical protein
LLLSIRDVVMTTSVLVARSRRTFAAQEFRADAISAA